MQEKPFIDISTHSEFLQESIKLYMDSFEEDEREDKNKILKNIANGNYKMFSYIQKKTVIGFYILDINYKLNYTICCFLAVKKSSRGRGFGSQLCLHAISYFNSDIKCNWLLIEAKKRQAKLYTKLGFKRVNIDYRIPIFNSKDSVKTDLMLIHKKVKIDKLSLSNIIKDIFYRGYSLKKNDKRIKNQLLSINLTQTL